jgi:aminoglycoside phosphotransferase family enzyme
MDKAPGAPDSIAPRQSCCSRHEGEPTSVFAGDAEEMVDGRQRPTIDLAAKVRFLSEPRAYPRVTTRVEARETHMSWVFLTDDRVYKLKKPVKYPFLDFSTLSRRGFFCEEELRLNRRLAGNTYCSVVPLRCDGPDRLNLTGQGSVVDWLVEMKRLPQADLLDTRLRRGKVTEADIRRIGDLLGDFYSACAPEIVEGHLYAKHLLEEQAVNRAILGRPELGMANAALPVLDGVDRALESLVPRIERRIAEGRIVEGHGDLRPEHVFIGEPIQVIDSLEFSRPMRIVDPYDEINYLGLECAVLGAFWIRPILLDMLEARLGGRPDDETLAVYGGFRALLRARLCMAHLLDALVATPDKWTPLALAYVERARGELNSPSQPALR